MTWKHCLISLCLILALAGAADAQTPDVKGFVSSADFSGSTNADGHVLKLSSSVGYNLTEHFGMDFGVPFYFVGGSSSSTTGTKTSFSGTGMGAPFVNARWMFNGHSLNYAGSLTDYLPLGDTANGLSTGEWAFDWNNHFERSIGRVTPFGEVGIANTVADSRKFNRPYVSHGFNAHFEGGASVDVTDKFSIGGSAYDIAPWGTQTIYSRALPKNSHALAGNGKANQVFTQDSVTTGTADIAKDRGFSAWADFSPVPYATAELGFTRSQSFALNTVSFGIRFNIGRMLRSARSHN